MSSVVSSPSNHAQRYKFVRQNLRSHSPTVRSRFARDIHRFHLEEDSIQSQSIGHSSRMNRIRTGNAVPVMRRFSSTAVNGARSANGGTRARMMIGTTAVVGVGALMLIKAGEPLRADAGEYLPSYHIFGIVDQGAIVDEL